MTQEPTPDLSKRPLHELTVENGTRPKAQKSVSLTPAQREAGRQLAAIHRHYLHDMARMMTVLHRIEAGDAPPEELQHVILAADMSQNLKAFGNLCGHHCQILTLHHNIEQMHMFPDLETRGDIVIQSIVKRLRKEHEVVHELLTRLSAAAGQLSEEPSDANFHSVKDIFRQLETVIRSHFKYEETELHDALGYLHIGI